MTRPSAERIEEIRRENRMQGGGGMEEELLNEIDALTEERDEWKDNERVSHELFEASQMDGAELQKSRDQLKARCAMLEDTLRWIMPKVHQGNHDGPFDECPKATCLEYRKALADA